MVVFDATFVMRNAVFKLIDLVVKLNKCFSERLKSDHDISFVLKSVFVLMLGPDFFPLVEIVDLTVEIAFWDKSFAIVVVAMVWCVVVLLVWIMWNVFFTDIGVVRGRVVTSVAVIMVVVVIVMLIFIVVSRVCDIGQIVAIAISVGIV